MNLKRTLVGGIIAAALTAGLASGAVAQTNDTDAELAAGDGENVCALAINGGGAFDFGTYIYTNGDYLHGVDRISALDFAIVIVTDDHPTDCEVDVQGSNLTFGSYEIPVGRISIVQDVDGSPVPVTTVAALSGTDQLLIDSVNVSGQPLGNGTANATITLTLTNDDDNNAPGAYQGDITFTSTADVP